MKTSATSFPFVLTLTILALTGVHGLEFHRRHHDPCLASCSHVLAAATACSSNVLCLCPTILASGLACSSCLASVDEDATDAAFIGSAYAECEGAGPTPTLTSDPCDATCSNVLLATEVCSTNVGCLCPTILASGLACSLCLEIVDADFTDAAFIGSAYAECTKAGPTPTSTSGPQSSQQSSTVPLPPASSGTSAASSSPTASGFVQFKSGAHGFGEMYGSGNVEMIMLLAIVAGLFTAFF